MTDQRVAIKVMARELAGDAEALARFRREADVTSAIGHPHLEREDCEQRFRRCGWYERRERGDDHRSLRRVASSLDRRTKDGVMRFALRCKWRTSWWLNPRLAVDFRSGVAMQRRERDSGDGVLGRAQVAADAVGQLVGKHLLLARLELRSEMRALGWRASLFAVLIAVVIVGYGLTMTGVALTLAGNRLAGVRLLVLGGAHLGGGSALILLAGLRARRRRLLEASASELRQTLHTLGLAPEPADKVPEPRAVTGQGS
jgi:hypothetical protein